MYDLFNIITLSVA